VTPDFTVDIWTTIIIEYNPTDGIVLIKINGYTETGSCPTLLANRNVLSTRVGGSISTTEYVDAALAGFHAVDRLLSPTETSDVVRPPTSSRA